jgi:DNA-binding NarL/FixJ family response regulator
VDNIDPVIVIIDDEHPFAEGVIDLFNFGLGVKNVKHYEKAETALAADLSAAKVILVDTNLKKDTSPLDAGDEVVRQIRKKYPGLHFIVGMSAEPENQKRWLGAGADVFIVKADIMAVTDLISHLF